MTTRALESQDMGAPVDGPSDKKRGLNRITDVNRSMTLKEARAFARRWAQNATILSPKYREKRAQELEDGTLHPMIHKAILEIAGFVIPKGSPDLGDGAMGLINFLMRHPLTEDPLAQAKPVEGGKVIEHEPLPLPAGQPASIVPPSRPRKPKGSGPPLKPGETVME